MAYEIHFQDVHGKKLLAEGCTNLSGLPILFTLDNTTRLEKHGDEYLYRYQSNAEGLSTAVYLGSQAQEALADALEIVGKLVVYADRYELSDDDQCSIGWLIASLGELSRQVSSATYSASKALASGHYLNEANRQESEHADP